MIDDLFSIVEGAPIAITPEGEFIRTLADSCFRGSPDGPPWLWAAQNVWLGGKMAPEPKLYDPDQTPWAKKWHEFPLRDSRELWVKKCSRSSFSETGLNVIRWMPENWPGNALFAINSNDEAKKVSKGRLLTTLDKAVLSEDPDDTSTHLISLPNMDIVVSGSGAAGPFMQTWYRWIVLDELENHQTHNQETTTVDRARSRLVGVADGKIYGGSKPELAGGIIDLQYIRGTQEKWLVPCPRCDQHIELLFEYLRFSHCKEKDGWNLARVLKETYYQCQCCGGRIEHHEKDAMVKAGEWTPTASKDRRRPPSGQAVAAEPGVESYHISDLYSLWSDLTWGFLACEYLSAFVIDPNITRQKYFRTNHLGLPWEPIETQIKEDKVLALVAGITEQREDRTVKLGEAYELAYHDHKFHSRLPWKDSIWLTLTADKQEHFIKFWVQAWLWDGQGFLVDCGFVKDYEALLELRSREYWREGAAEPDFIQSGLIDCGEDKMDVLRCCLKAQELGFQLHPSRGSGFHSEFKDKTIRYRADVCDGQEIVIREYFDHAIKNDFMLGKVSRRSEPRLWFPRDLATAAPWVMPELRAERLIVAMVNGRRVQKWVHDKQKHGPNDALDLGKCQYVILQEIKEELKLLKPEASAEESAAGEAESMNLGDAVGVTKAVVATLKPGIQVRLHSRDQAAAEATDAALQALPKGGQLLRSSSGEIFFDEQGLARLVADNPTFVAFAAWKQGYVAEVLMLGANAN